MTSGLPDWLKPAGRFWDGIYVLYDYTAPRKASQAVQKYLSTPIVGSEMNILRCPMFQIILCWHIHNCNWHAQVV
jgi:hypothetical protein